jgi:hypothetical protein
VTISGNGIYAPAPFTPTTPGVYRWVASYSGDANNDAAATACADPAGSVTVSATTQPPPPTVQRVRPAGVVLAVSPGRDLQPPFRFVLTARLGIPRAAAAGACRGRVRLTAHAGRRLVAVRNPALARRGGVCSVRAVIVFRRRTPLGARTATLRMRAAFAGNAALLPRASRIVVVRVLRP